MVRRNFCLVALGALAVAVSAFAADSSVVKSGIKVGGDLPPFYVKDITGDQKDKDSLCYRCRYGNSPVVAVFARSVNDKTSKLIARVDQLVQANKEAGLKGFVVFVADDTDPFEPKLTKLAAEKKIVGTPLTVYKGADGPADYEISKDADLTVLMWVEGVVKVNHALKAGKLDDKQIDVIAKDVKKILAK